MKSVKSYSLFIVLLFTSAAFAQEFQFGVRLEARHYATNTENVPDPSHSLSSFQIFGAAMLNENTALEARFGADGNNFYRGGEVGILSKYYYKDFYAVCGIVYHHMTGDNLIRDNRSTVSGYDYSLRQQDLFLPSLGLGYSPVKHLSVELLFQNALDKKVGFYDDWSLLAADNLYHGYNTIRKEITLAWLVNLGVSYSFSL